MTPGKDEVIGHFHPMLKDDLDILGFLPERNPKCRLTVGAEGVSDFVLRDGRQPDRGVDLDLRGWDEDSVVTRVDGGQAPEGEAEAAVGVEAEGHVARWVEFALQLHCSAECGRRGV